MNENPEPQTTPEPVATLPAIVAEGGGAGNQLIALALERNADPAVLAKLMDLQERWESNAAKKAYVQAMTGFKQEAPAVIAKTDRVDFQSSKGRTAYNYANLGSIVQEITALLGKYELSASWSCEQNGPKVTVTCNITHAQGHRESVTLTGPIDESGNKNQIQAVGSTVTYLQRYTLLAALGLATVEDDDSTAAREPIQKPQARTQQATAAPAPKPDDTRRETVTGFVENSGSKKGETNGKKWNRYGFQVNGAWYNTFDSTLATVAEDAQEAGVEVQLVWKPGQNDSRDIVQITPAIVQVPVEVEDDLPFDTEAPPMNETGELL